MGPMKVVFHSFGGRYSDNPRAIYEEVVRRGYEIDPVWVHDALHTHGFPAGVRTVAYGTQECIDALEAADLIVSNTHLEMEWQKKPGATYLQTWHGTPLKHIHFDVLWAPEGRLEYLTHDVRRWDALLSPNPASTGPLRQAFDFHGPVLETGYPRNDLLNSPERDEVRARVRAQLGISEDQKVVLYTPTWRDDLVDDRGELDFSLQFDLDRFGLELGRDHVLLLRLHYMISGRYAADPRPGVIDVSFHPDIAELYLAADVMVTDYSSTMFDFAVTGKPLVFYTYDLDDYRDRLRGFYFDFAEHAPGPLLATSAEVMAALRDLDAVRERFAERYQAFQATFCSREDGAASGRVVDRFFPDAARTERSGELTALGGDVA